MRRRYLRIILEALIDVISVEVSIFIALWLFSTFHEVNFHTAIYQACVLMPVATVLISYIFRVYHVMWQFAHTFEYLKVCISSFTSIFLCFAFQFSIHSRLPLRTYCIIVILLTGFMVSVRLLSRKLDQRQNYGDNDYELGRVMIIGAGDAGAAVIEDINTMHARRGNGVKCVIDDDTAKRGQSINGVRIVGDRSEIIRAAKNFQIDTIIFAISSIAPEQKANIMRICQETGCRLQTVPSIQQLISDSSLKLTTVRNVEIEDLLGREPIEIGSDTILNYVCGKTVMVTGGGGSIGSELCRQIAAHCPKRLIIFDIYENNAYDIQNELKNSYPDLDLVTLIGSVRDVRRLECVFDQYHPQIVYHAAAHKHVPLMEDSPNEAIKNNVFGTYQTAECAGRFGVERFVLISTDKAVNPTNIMGASKRICEMIVQTANRRYDTDYVAVRFGNVLGSNGSVIPLFKRQIAEGGPVTVTDPKIIRYFMTIPEAVSLVLQAGATAKGGEIFVLDMGEPVKILDLAENLIRLSGLTPYEDINIVFTGLRPGEKLYEELLMSEEGLKQTDNSLIYIGQPIEIDVDLLEQTLQEMQRVMCDDNADIRALVHRIVPTYQYKATEAAEAVH